MQASKGAKHSAYTLVIALEVLEVTLLLLLARLPLGGCCRCGFLLLPLSLLLLEAVWLEAAGAAAVALHWPAIHQVERVLLRHAC